MPKIITYGIIFFNFNIFGLKNTYHWIRVKIGVCLKRRLSKCVKVLFTRCKNITIKTC